MKRNRRSLDWLKHSIWLVPACLVYQTFGTILEIVSKMSSKVLDIPSLYYTFIVSVVSGVASLIVYNLKKILHYSSWYTDAVVASKLIDIVDKIIINVGRYLLYFTFGR